MTMTTAVVSRSVRQYRLRRTDPPRTALHPSCTLPPPDGGCGWGNGMAPCQDSPDRQASTHVWGLAGVGSVSHLPWFTRACVDGDSSVFRGSKPVCWFVKCTRRSDEGSIDLIGLVGETSSIMEAIG